MTNKPVIPLDSNPGHFPPWSAEQQDAQIEALRFVLHELMRTLHESGQLHIPALQENLSNAEWIFADKRPDTLEAVRLLSVWLGCMPQKSAPPRRRRGKNAAPE